MEWKWNKFNSVYDAVNSKTKGKANEFLNGTGKEYKIQNLDILAAWIKYYAENDVPFYIVGDYDADGVTASSELYILLKKIGVKKLTIRIPKRPEGYGMSVKIIDEFDDPGVIITVDNGIAALDAVAEAKKRGFIVLVTDHHLPPVKDGKIVLPEADLIVDAHVDDSLIQKNGVAGTQFDGYCGAGIVYKLAQLMIPGTREMEEIAALAAIATIADVVPLLEDNRNIYKSGIEAIKARRITPGLQKIIDILRSDNMVSETDIGFKIAPMLNAPGRIYPDGATLSMKALLSRNFRDALDLVNELNDANEERKHMKGSAVKRAGDIMDSECLYGSNPIVIYDPKTDEGVIGLVAGELTEKHNAASIVFTDSEYPDVIKGSGRAPEYCNLKEALDKVNNAHPEFFKGYGGHARAAGVSIYKKYLDEFADAMQDAMGPAMPAPDYVEYDIEVTAGDLMTVTDEIEKFGPYGEGNPPIVVRVNNFKLVPKGNAFYNVMGEDSIRFFGAGCEAVGFGLAAKYERERSPMELDIVGKLSYHYFMGNRTPQLEIIDFEPSKTEPVQLSDLSMSINAQLQQFGLL